MDFTRLSILEMDGITRSDLCGEYDDQELASILVEAWIPYYECDKCGKVDFCKYTEPHQYRPGRTREIKCGVAVNALQNFVRVSFPVLSKIEKSHQQKVLDAAYYFTRYIYESEQYNGLCIDPEMLDWFGQYSLGTMVRISRLAEDLTQFRSLLRDVPDFSYNIPIFFVEGEAEEAFLFEMQKTRSSWFQNLNVRCIGGEGNFNARRVTELFQQLRRQGYNVFVQADGDVNNCIQAINTLIANGVLDEEKVVKFKYDFESTFPPGMLLKALQQLKKLEGVTKEEFEMKVYSQAKSVVKTIRTVYGIDLDPLKVNLAKELASVLKESGLWWTDEEFLKTEIGELLKFIMHIPSKL